MVKPLVVAVTLAAMAALEPISLQAQTATSVYNGVGQAGPLLPHSHLPCAGGETVAVIQDSVEWFAPIDAPLGANIAELTAQQKGTCAIHSNQLGATNLQQFGAIVIAAAQTQDFYNNVFPSGTIHPAISQFVQNGGILLANLTDCASGPGAGGTWATQLCDANAITSFVFVGGVKHANVFDQNNNIADPVHSIIANALPCPSGNCAQVVDVANLQDLDGWNFSSHGYFINLPAGTKNIIVDALGRPVMVEYPFGTGDVVATLTTTEWRYVGDFGSLPRNKKLLANEIASFFTLSVPLFKQFDSPWGAQEYDDGNSQTLNCGTTMRACGCAVSSVAMVLAFHGVTLDPHGNPTNPGTVNDYFKLDSKCNKLVCVSRGYFRGSVIWTAAGQYSMDAHRVFNTPIIEYADDGLYDAQILRSEIHGKRPVILREPGHFIVGTGYFGSSFKINDPFFDRGRLDDPAYRNTSNGFVRYRVTSTDLSGVVVSVLAPAQVLITDPNGNRTGFDPVTSTILRNIANSSYVFEQALADDSGQNPPPPADAGIHMAIIRVPSDGHYTIEVSSPSVANLEYSFAVHAYDRNANLSLNLFEAQLVPGRKNVFEFTYSSAPGARTLALLIPVDIKPGSFPNSINLDSEGNIPVAILTTNTFDASSVDPSTVRFGATGTEAPPVQSSLEDVNGDGRADMILHFKTQATGTVCGQTSATLTGKTFDGTNIQGSDSVRVVGDACK